MVMCCNRQIRSENHDYCKTLQAIKATQQIHDLAILLFPACNTDRMREAWTVATEKILLIQAELARCLNNGHYSKN